MQDVPQGRRRGRDRRPDLTKIGAKYNKAALLDQILEPSRTIDPQFMTHLLETKDGRILSGPVRGEERKDVWCSRTHRARRSRSRVRRSSRLVPQSRSLMPELLLRDLTAQQVADLLEFLASLR